MSEFVVFTEEFLHSFYDPATCSYMVPLSGKAAHDMKMLRDENATLEAENAKLRELVRGLNYCSDELNSAECERCPLYDPADTVLEPKCVRMMRELGIEVSE